MSSLQRRIAFPIEKRLAALAARAADLNAQFRELETLRDLVRKAQKRPWGRRAPHLPDKAAGAPR
jgi:hypothetical protein